MADERTAFLTGFGRLSWPEVQKLIGSNESCWADLDGWHIGPLPSQAPPTTHLWSWGEGALWRLRVDGEEAVVGRLTDAGAPDGAEVTVYRSDTAGWGDDDAQVHPRGELPSSRRWQLHEVPGAGPVTFVRALPAS